MSTVNAAQSNLPEKWSQETTNPKTNSTLKTLSYCVFMTGLLFGDGLSLTQKQAGSAVPVSLNK